MLITVVETMAPLILLGLASACNIGITISPAPNDNYYLLRMKALSGHLTPTMTLPKKIIGSVENND